MYVLHGTYHSNNAVLTEYTVPSAKT